MDPQTLAKMLQNTGLNGAPTDPVTDMLRALNYQQGIEQLKEQMLPAITGRDYVPPYARFDDSATQQDIQRKSAAGAASAPWLKDIEAEFELRNNAPHPDVRITYPPGYNGNNRT